MGRYDTENVEIEDDDLNIDAPSRRFAGGHSDQPRRSPIRRKDKWRQEESTKAKAKRRQLKIQRRFKYDWQGD